MGQLFSLLGEKQINLSHRDIGDKGSRIIGQELQRNHM